MRAGASLAGLPSLREIFGAASSYTANAVPAGRAWCTQASAPKPVCPQSFALTFVGLGSCRVDGPPPRPADAIWRSVPARGAEVLERHRADIEYLVEGGQQKNILRKEIKQNKNAVKQQHFCGRRPGALAGRASAAALSVHLIPRHRFTDAPGVSPRGQHVYRIRHIRTHRDFSPETEVDLVSAPGAEMPAVALNGVLPGDAHTLGWTDLA